MQEFQEREGLFEGVGITKKHIFTPEGADEHGKNGLSVSYPAGVPIFTIRDDKLDTEVSVASTDIVFVRDACNELIKRFELEKARQAQLHGHIGTEVQR